MITAFGLERGYYVSIPAPYDPAVPHALVFGYHGSNYTGRMMRTYLDMEKAPLVVQGDLRLSGRAAAGRTTRARRGT